MEHVAPEHRPGGGGGGGGEVKQGEQGGGGGGGEVQQGEQGGAGEVNWPLRPGEGVVERMGLWRKFSTPDGMPWNEVTNFYTQGPWLNPQMGSYGMKMCEYEQKSSIFKWVYLNME